MSRRPDNTLQIDRAASAVLANITGAILANSIGPEDVTDYSERVSQALTQIATEVRFAADDFLPRRTVNRNLGEGLGSSKEMLLALNRGTRDEELAAAVQHFGPRWIAELVTGLSSAFAYDLSRITYLGPLRSYPGRHLAFAEDRDHNWQAGGGYAWDIIRTNEDVREAVNRWLCSDRLKSRYRLEIRNLAAVEALEQPLRDALETTKIDIVEEGYPPGHDSSGREYDGEMPVWGIPDLEAEAARIVQELRRRSDEKFQELVLMDIVQNTPVSHRDVGIGISQVLPVLVHAYADFGQIVAIEQPEIHLHPMLQTHLGDVFIESAKNRGNTFIIETHSEHLLLRIMKRMRQTFEGTLPEGQKPITPDDVALLFVSPDAAGSVVQDIGLNQRGKLVKGWPGGFFEEGVEEMFG